MARVIYFDAEPMKKGVIRFVEDYRRGGFLRREKIQYGIAGGHLPVVDDIHGAFARIVRDYPGAIIYDGTVAEVENKLDSHRCWAITKQSGNGFDVYYSHTTAGHIEWTSDINNAELNFDVDSAHGVAGALRRAGVKASVTTVYLNYVNTLLTKSFILLCESRKSGVIKFFARHEEGNRIRLVKNSDVAARFTYEEAFALQDSLKQSNKAFFYTVRPAFRENVHFTSLKDYLASGKVAVAVSVSDKLKFMNR